MRQQRLGPRGLRRPPRFLAGQWPLPHAFPDAAEICVHGRRPPWRLGGASAADATTGASGHWGIGRAYSLPVAAPGAALVHTTWCRLGGGPAPWQCPPLVQLGAGWTRLGAGDAARASAGRCPAPGRHQCGKRAFGLAALLFRRARLAGPGVQNPLPRAPRWQRPTGGGGPRDVLAHGGRRDRDRRGRSWAASLCGEIFSAGPPLPLCGGGSVRGSTFITCCRCFLAPRGAGSDPLPGAQPCSAPRGHLRQDFIGRASRWLQSQTSLAFPYAAPGHTHPTGAPLPALQRTFDWRGGLGRQRAEDTVAASAPC
mmetsp:Transcript_70844/g.151704  ORF Transcript_70844/g.151704 Transcript_70844/m.151704 type:complete len:312 (-) Transcript_70844:3933-4868(-)